MTNVHQDHERRQKLLAKVGKLMAQAAGTPYEGEAHSAYIMAQRLMAENGLSAAEVDGLSEAEQAALVTDEVVDKPVPYWRPWRRDLAQLIADNFRCVLYYDTRLRKDGERVAARFHFVGFADDVAIARDVYRSACEVAPRLAKEYAQDPLRVERHLNTLWGRDPDDMAVSSLLGWYSRYSRADENDARREMRAAFLDGFLEGLEAQFRAQVGADPTLALLLVIHPAVRDHMAEIIPPGRPPLEEDPDRDYPTDEEALRAGHEAGRTFRAERTPRLGEGTRQLPC